MCFLFITPGKAQLSLCIETNTVGQNTVIADVIFNTESAILGLQYSINWDSTELEFEEISYVNDIVLPGIEPTVDYFGFPWNLLSSNSGALTCVYDAQFAVPVSLGGTQKILSLKFKHLAPNNPNPSIVFSDHPTPIQFIDENEKEIEVVSTEECVDWTTLSGSISTFEDDNCSIPKNDFNFNNWTVVAKRNSVHTYYGSVAQDGSYVIYLPEGTYEVSLVPPSELWANCQAPNVIQILNLAEQYTLDLSAFVEVNCPIMSVDISTSLISSCYPNIYICKFENFGTTVAEDAYVEIQFDELIEVDSASLPWVEVVGNQYKFELGDIGAGIEESFVIFYKLACDADPNITQCTEAKIFPNAPCIAPSPTWSKANIEVTGVCESDEIKFTIKNTGSGDMLEPLKYVVSEDIVMAKQGVFQLTQEESQEIRLPATGKTYRLVAEQAPFHPVGNRPSVAVEGCSDGSPISFGIITQFPLDDDPLFVDIDCQENINFTGQNRLRAVPKGYDEDHKLDPGTPLEYTINFQNIRLDTAFNLVILDTLPSFLDPLSIQPGSSSHPYEFELIEDGVARFYFPDILLPNGFLDNYWTHGFVKFKINQKPDLPVGTVIENRAGIYFDFNAPIITNTVYHTIYESFIKLATPSTTNVGESDLHNIQVSVHPNPMSDNLTISVDYANASNLQFQIYNLYGGLVLNRPIHSNGLTIERGQLRSGIYVFRINDGSSLIANGKLIVK